jgi:ornithine cyclodeaminase
MTGIKWAHIYPDNRQRRDLPSISVVIILNDATTGFPVAIMDGTVLSAMRTGAATGVGAKYLARPDAETVGLLGAGVYSRTQLMALRLVLPHLKQVKVFALSPERAAVWAQEMERQLEVPIRVAGTAREAVENSDVVVSVTGGKTASQPYVEPDWMAEGSLFSAVSDVDPKPELILASDRVVVDTRETLVHGAGHISNLYSQGRLKREDVVEIGEIINGKQPGRRGARERIFYNPWGISIEDIITAHSVYEEAKRKGLGQELYLWREPKWA